MTSFSSQSALPWPASRRALQQILVWLLAEVMLSFVGLDDIADYSEYIFKATELSTPPVITTISA